MNGIEEGIKTPIREEVFLNRRIVARSNSELDLKVTVRKVIELCTEFQEHYQPKESGIISINKEDIENHSYAQEMAFPLEKINQILMDLCETINGILIPLHVPYLKKRSASFVRKFSNGKKKRISMQETDIINLCIKVKESAQSLTSTEMRGRTSKNVRSIMQSEGAKVLKERFKELVEAIKIYYPNKFPFQFTDSKTKKPFWLSGNILKNTSNAVSTRNEVGLARGIWGKAQQEIENYLKGLRLTELHQLKSKTYRTTLCSFIPKAEKLFANWDGIKDDEQKLKYELEILEAYQEVLIYLKKCLKNPTYEENHDIASHIKEIILKAADNFKQSEEILPAAIQEANKLVASYIALNHMGKFAQDRSSQIVSYLLQNWKLEFEKCLATYKYSSIIEALLKHFRDHQEDDIKRAIWIPSLREQNTYCEVTKHDGSIESLTPLARTEMEQNAISDTIQEQELDKYWLAFEIFISKFVFNDPQGTFIENLRNLIDNGKKGESTTPTLDSHVQLYKFFISLLNRNLVQKSKFNFLRSKSETFLDPDVKSFEENLKVSNPEAMANSDLEMIGKVLLRFYRVFLREFHMAAISYISPAYKHIFPGDSLKFIPVKTTNTIKVNQQTKEIKFRWLKEASLEGCSIFQEIIISLFCSKENQNLPLEESEPSLIFFTEFPKTASPEEKEKLFKKLRRLNLVLEGQEFPEGSFVDITPHGQLKSDQHSETALLQEAEVKMLAKDNNSKPSSLEDQQ